MNKVILMGRLTRDPEIKYSYNGGDNSAIVRYTLAVDRRFKRDGDEVTADFIPCVAFGKSAEFAEKYLHKGTKIAIVGRIQTGSYTNKDGNKVYTTDVIIEEQEFAESKAAEGQAGKAQPQAQTQKGQRPQPEQASADGFMSVFDAVEDDGLPFN